MKQTIMSKKAGPLLKHAISKLRPEVFSHPIWIRFCHKKQTIPPETIQDLFAEADQLQHDHPRDAFQILLICAVGQNYSGHWSAALTTLQRALDLAECTSLSQEVLWAIWGACAVCVQQGNYGQAAAYFSQLQTVLYEQNEWMLADYIDVVKQLLLCPEISGIVKYPDAIEYQEFGPLLTCTFDWLNRWGYSDRPDSAEESDQLSDRSGLLAFSEQSWCPTEGRHEPWHTLKLLLQGELRIHGVKSGSESINGPSWLWRFIQRLLGIERSDRTIDNPVVELEHQDVVLSTTYKVTEIPAPLIPSAEQKPHMESSSARIIAPKEEMAVAIPLSVHMLGKFELRIYDLTCKLPVSRSLSLLKYLIFNHKQNTPRDTLMDVFWPETASETGRNNLNVAMHNIRRALQQVTDHPVILYSDGAYGIAPNVRIWLDVDEFERLVALGKRLESQNQLAAVSEYEAAVSIYQGDFLQENLYEGWTVLTRESLRLAYLKTLDSLSQIYFNQEQYASCISTCQLILARDGCREDAHCMLMRCYNHQGQDHLALRQYQACVQALRSELDVTPAPSTVHLYQQIRKHAHV